MMQADQRMPFWLFLQRHIKAREFRFAQMSVHGAGYGGSRKINAITGRAMATALRARPFEVQANMSSAS